MTAETLRLGLQDVKATNEVMARFHLALGGVRRDRQIVRGTAPESSPLTIAGTSTYISTSGGGERLAVAIDDSGEGPAHVSVIERLSEGSHGKEDPAVIRDTIAHCMEASGVRVALIDAPEELMASEAIPRVGFRLDESGLAEYALTLAA